MKLIIALDSFKGRLTALQACEVVGAPSGRETLLSYACQNPWRMAVEEQARALFKAQGRRWIPKTAMGPLPEMSITAGFAWFEAERLALIEMAASIPIG